MTSTYICDPSVCSQNPNADGNIRNGSGHCWHESLWRRLTWQYGEGHANTIVLGLDRKTESDRTAWNGLGG